MELELVGPTNLSIEPVECIYKVLIYFLSTGRNAWHGIWSAKYTTGCMHTSLLSAQEAAEKKRTQGTVFYIQQLPCLAYRSKSNLLLVTQINTEEPLSWFSCEPVRKRESYQQIATSDFVENPLTAGSPIKAVASSFHFDSVHWEIEPPSRDSVMLLTSMTPMMMFEELAMHLRLHFFQSYSQGGYYKLGWKKYDSQICASAVFGLHKKFVY